MNMLGQRRSRGRSLATAFVGFMALVVGLGVATAGAASAAPSDGVSPVVHSGPDAKVTSRVTGTTEDGRRVVGRFTPTSFDVAGDTLQATGELTGRIPGEGRFTETVTVPVKSVNGSSLDGATGATGMRASSLAAAAAPGCDVLNLVLGPLDLNLLGLEVSLDQVVLDIIARPGAGQLLGNLLCSVAGLLDGGLSGLLGRLGDLLNQILGALSLGG
jgi:hypothetical protein